MNGQTKDLKISATGKNQVYDKSKQQQQSCGNSPKNNSSTICDPSSLAQSQKTNIEVLVRVRVPTMKEKESIESNENRIIVKPIDSQNLLFDPKDSSQSTYVQGLRRKIRIDYNYNKKPNKEVIFTHDRVYGPESSNFDIFNESLRKVVDSLIEGFNCSVFAYGATGAGKTFTMLGSLDTPGMCFYMAMELYGRINRMSVEYESEVVVSYLEVYNETLRDLLHPSDVLSIQEDTNLGITIPNLTMHKPKDATELLSMLNYGNSLRTNHPTDQNQTSSRSHAIFQVLISLRKRYSEENIKFKMIQTKLLMVDLAGSERGSNSLSDGPRFREGSNINKSLLALGNVINALADGKKHIPYRDSKLTRLMKDAIGGNCRTIMIANISPCQTSYDDTYNTLKYAERVKEIKVQLKRNYCTMDDHSSYINIIEDLKGEVERLKLQLQDRELGKHHQAQNFPSIQSTSINTTTTINNKKPSSRGGGKKPAKVYHQGSGDEVEVDFDFDGKVNEPPVPPPVPPPSVEKVTASSLASMVHDPIALENFIKLLGLKKKYEEDHMLACVNARETSWQKKWTKWRLTLASTFDHLGGNDVLQQLDGQNANENVQELKNNFTSLAQGLRSTRERAKLSKTILDFNEKEIESAIENFLVKTRVEDPFLVVTLKEFLYYKTLEREVLIHRHVQNHNKRMALSIFGELINQERILIQSFDLLEKLQLIKNPGYGGRDHLPGGRKWIEEKFSHLKSMLLSLGYQPSTIKGLRSDLVEKCLTQNIWQLLKKPVDEYESPDPNIESDAEIDQEYESFMKNREQELMREQLKLQHQFQKNQNVKREKPSSPVQNHLSTFFRNRVTIDNHHTSSSSQTDLGSYTEESPVENHEKVQSLGGKRSQEKFSSDCKKLPTLPIEKLNDNDNGGVKFTFKSRPAEPKVRTKVVAKDCSMAIEANDGFFGGTNADFNVQDQSNGNIWAPNPQSWISPRKVQPQPSLITQLICNNKDLNSPKNYLLQHPSMFGLKNQGKSHGKVETMDKSNTRTILNSSQNQKQQHQQQKSNANANLNLNPNSDQVFQQQQSPEVNLFPENFRGIKTPSKIPEIVEKVPVPVLLPQVPVVPLTMGLVDEVKAYQDQNSNKNIEKRISLSDENTTTGTGTSSTDNLVTNTKKVESKPPRDKSLKNLPKSSKTQNKLSLRFNRRKNPVQQLGTLPLPSKKKPCTNLKAQLDQDMTPFSSLSESEPSKKGSQTPLSLSTSSSSQVMGCVSLPELGNPGKKSVYHGLKRKKDESEVDEDGGGDSGRSSVALKSCQGVIDMNSSKCAISDGSGDQNIQQNSQNNNNNSDNIITSIMNSVPPGFE